MTRMNVINKHVILLILFSTLFYACTSTIRLETIEEANGKIGSGSAELFMKRGNKYYVRKMNIEKDITSFYNEAIDSAMMVRTDEIGHISVMRRTAGCFMGAWIGGAAGGAIGYIADSQVKSREFKGWAYFLWIPVGITAGTLAGAVTGHSYIYILPQEYDSVKDANTRFQTN